MNKSLSYLIILAAIIGIAAFMYFTQKTNTLDNSSLFAIADTASITRVLIEGDDGRKINLTKVSPNYWKLNERHKARPDAIETLLNTIKKIRVRFPVGNASYDNVMKTFEKPLKTVSIYTKENPETPIKKYMLGGITQDKAGTYMLLEGSSSPYVVGVLGMEGHLLTRYFTMVEEWRDRLIFDYEANQIASIKAEYPYHPAYSFQLTVEETKGATVVPLEKEGEALAKTTPNQSTIQEYLQSFEKLYAEAFENGHVKIDSVKTSKPFCKMTITNKGGKKKEMIVHYVPINKRSKLQFFEDGSPVPFDVDRYLAFINKGNDLVMIQRYVFEKVFKKYKDFLSLPAMEKTK